MTWTFKQIEPQPARGTLREEMWDDRGYLTEIKYDGFRLVGQCLSDGCGAIMEFTTRRISKRTGKFQIRSLQLPHLNGIPGQPYYVQVPKKMIGTVLDGELVLDPKHAALVRAAGGGLSKAVGSIVNSLPPEAMRKQIERGWLRLVIFDCLFYRGEDLRHLPLSERRTYVESAARQWNNPCVSIAERDGGDKRAFYKRTQAAGEEGLVFKKLSAPYGVQSAWAKLKEEWTADCVIMGFKSAKEMSTKKGDDAPSMTKYAKLGLIGAVVVGQQVPSTEVVNLGHTRTVRRVEEVATISGMTDALRAKLTRDGKKYLGRVVRILHNGREPTGRFRHPRWDGFRDDKAAKDCIYREGEI